MIIQGSILDWMEYDGVEAPRLNNNYDIVIVRTSRFHKDVAFIKVTVSLSGEEVFRGWVTVPMDLIKISDFEIVPIN